MIALLYEPGGYRQIYTDGRALPKDPNPVWIVYAVGHPHSERLRVTEKFRRTDFGHVTCDDPETMTGPLTISVAVNYAVDGDMLEYVCNEDEQDTKHLVGTAKSVAHPNSTDTSAAMNSVTAMGWQKHTTRAILSAGGAPTKNHGLVITTENESSAGPGPNLYRATTEKLTTGLSYYATFSCEISVFSASNGAEATQRSTSPRSRQCFILLPLAYGSFTAYSLNGVGSFPLLAPLR